MKIFTLFVLAMAFTQAGCSQSGKRTRAELPVGGGCEGCEAIYESLVSFDKLDEVDTLPDFNEDGPRIEISGVVYKRDGKTPAPGVVLYVYHTDQQGRYSRKTDDALGNTTWGKRHGYIRGWVKTNAKGVYRFYTLVPASYPNSSNPKHIHPIVKEPGFSEYWIDEFVFEDDPLLPASERNRPAPVGGSGLLRPKFSGGMLKARRDIILGLNVRNYPAN